MKNCIILYCIKLVVVVMVTQHYKNFRSKNYYSIIEKSPEVLGNQLEYLQVYNLRYTQNKDNS